MSVFVDTAAFYALLDGDDCNHIRAKKIWERLLASDEALVTSTHVVIESCALIQHRLGLPALRAFDEDLLPCTAVVNVGYQEHRGGVQAVLAAGRKDLSVVDCVSFAVMVAHGLARVFTFDRHFSERGFEVLPNAD